MATAKTTSKPTTPDLQLNLSGEEVEALAGLLGCISGSPSTSSRRALDSIMEALAETLGFDPEDSASYPGELTPSVRFSGDLTARA